MPIRQPGTSLLTSQNRTLSGTRARLGETEEDTGDLGGMGEMSLGSGLGGLGGLGGMTGLSGMRGLSGLSGLGLGSGLSSLGGMGLSGAGEDLDLSSINVKQLQAMAGEPVTGVMTQTDRIRMYNAAQAKLAAQSKAAQGK